MQARKTRSIIGLIGTPVFAGWLCGVLLYGAMFWWAGSAAAGALYVSPVGTNNAPTYPDWTGAATSPNAAVNAATNGDTVYITNATYILTNEVVVTNGITIQGYGGQATINGGRTGGVSGVRCFYLNHTNAVLDTLAVIQGYAASGNRAGYGGGAYVEKCLVIQNCTVYSNYAYGGVGTSGRGGGVYMSAGILWGCIVSNNKAYVCGGVAADGVGCVVRDCTIVNNSATHSSLSPYYGGGVYVNGATVTNCTIAFNRAYNSGAGMAILGSALAQVKNCRIVGNSRSSTANIPGGGVYIPSGAPTVQNCSIISNYAGDAAGAVGGGINVSSSTGVVQNCLIAANQAYNGGGAYIAGLSQSCTIIGNSANNLGGGVYGASGAATNCIIYYNRSASTGSNIYSTLSAGYSCSPDLTNGVNGNITSAPQFVDAGSGYGTNHIAGNYRLSDSSPCMNAGVNESWMTNAMDLDGRPRLRYSAVDMGAYETIIRGTFFSVR